MNTLTIPQTDRVTSCGDCPHATKSKISKVLYTCSLWGEVVKESDIACNSAVHNAEFNSACVMDGAFRVGGVN